MGRKCEWCHGGPYLAWRGPSHHTAPGTWAWASGGLQPPRPAWWAPPPRSSPPRRCRSPHPSRLSSSPAEGLQPGWSRRGRTTDAPHLNRKKRRKFSDSPVINSHSWTILSSSVVHILTILVSENVMYAPPPAELDIKVFFYLWYSL